MGTNTTSAYPLLDGPTVHPATVMTIGGRYHPLATWLCTTYGLCSNALRCGRQCRTTTSAPETHEWWLLCTRHPQMYQRAIGAFLRAQRHASHNHIHQLMMRFCVSIGQQHGASWRWHARQFSACPKGGNEPAARYPRGYDVAQPCRECHITSS